MEHATPPAHRCEPKDAERVALHLSRGWREVAHAPDIASAQARKQIAERSGDQTLLERDRHGGWLILVLNQE